MIFGMSVLVSMEVASKKSCLFFQDRPNCHSLSFSNKSFNNIVSWNLFVIFLSGLHQHLEEGITRSAMLTLQRNLETGYTQTSFLSRMLNCWILWWDMDFEIVQRVLVNTVKNILNFMHFIPIINWVQHLYLLRRNTSLQLRLSQDSAWSRGTARIYLPWKTGNKS